MGKTENNILLAAVATGAYYLNKNKKPVSNNRSIDNDSIIMELKYDQKYDLDSRRISTTFPFRFTKNSKYINGIARRFNFNI